MLESNLLMNAIINVQLFSGKYTAKVVPGRSWPNYSSISLCQMISVISRALQQQRN